MITQEFQQTILSQYSNSKALLELLEGFNYRVDPRKDVEAFFTDVFNLDTCGTYGLDVWGRIVAAPRGIRVQEPHYFGYRMTGFQPWGAKYHTVAVYDSAFGYDSRYLVPNDIYPGFTNPFFGNTGDNYLTTKSEVANGDRDPENSMFRFNAEDGKLVNRASVSGEVEAPFWNGQKSPTTVVLGNEMYRALIYFKAAANIMNTTLPEMNRLLWAYLDIRGLAGDCFIEKIGKMTLRAVFKFKIPYVDRAIFRTYGNLLRPAGHEIWFQEYSPATFGFRGSNLKPWNAGIFHRGNINDQFYQVEEN